MTETDILRQAAQSFYEIESSLDGDYRTMTPEEMDTLKAALEEPAPPPQSGKPNRMMTTIDGIDIGWDMCGQCSLHVTICECKGGPKEPAYFDVLRGKPRKVYANTAGSAPTAPPMPTTDVATTDVEPKSAAKPPKAAPSGLVPCSGHEGFVSLAEADRNDDGSYLCHACQEASV